MANLFWWDAWAGRQEELAQEGKPHANMSGCQIAEIADNPNEEQRKTIIEHTEKVIREIEKLNHAKIERIYQRALRADGFMKDEEVPEKASRDHFGSDLAFMSMGSGASWFDDHKEFKLQVPYHEFGYSYLNWEGEGEEEEEEET
jgi:alkaline phosphatase